MFLPPLCKPQDIGGTDPQLVATVKIECMCGNRVPLKDTIAVYTYKPGQTDPSWFAACRQQCIVANVSMGCA